MSGANRNMSGHMNLRPIVVVPVNQWWRATMFERGAPTMGLGGLDQRLDLVDRYLDMFDAAHELPDGSLPS